MDEKLTRRHLLGQSAALGALAIFGTAACGKKKVALVCNDTTGLSSADVSLRTSLQYTDMSLEAGKTCSNCQQFIPSAPNACGTCKVLKGPVNPSGNCKSFVAKPT